MTVNDESRDNPPPVKGELLPGIDAERLASSPVPVTVPLPDPATRRWYEPEIGIWPVVATPEQKRGRHQASTPCPDWVKAMIIQRIAVVGVARAMIESSYDIMSVYDWARRDPDGFGVQFDDARRTLAHNYAMSSVDILDAGSADETKDPKTASAHVNLLGARSRSRQWLASRLLPEVYGEKIEHRGTITQAVVMLPALDMLPQAATATARLAGNSEAPQISGALAETVEPEPDDGA